MSANIRNLFLFTILTFLPVSLFAADISVSNLELSTAASIVDERLVLSSHATADLSVAGGYKYAGLVRFGFDAADIEKAMSYGLYTAEPLDSSDTTWDANEIAAYNELVDRMNNSAVLSFKLAKMTVRDFLKLPIEFSYFIGEADDFCSGKDFSTRFGGAPVESVLRGWAYYPDGVGGNSALQYEGIHQVNGTGISMALTKSQKVIPFLYLYQDIAMRTLSELEGASAAQSGYLSGDLRLLVNSEHVKFETFAGATGPYDDYGLYRGGLLALLSTDTAASFLIQAGIPRWDPSLPLDIDNLYLLFEPRMTFSLASIYVTVFYHPYWYHQLPTGEQGNIDLNLRLMFGDIQKNTAQGGLETTMLLNSNATDTSDRFKLWVSPFFGVATEGLRWDFKLKVDPLSWDKPTEMVESYIGVRTAY